MDVIRSKCWIKERANQSNTKIALEESEKVEEKFDRDQTFIQQKISSSNAIFNFFANFAIRETDLTFHPTWEKCYVG